MYNEKSFKNQVIWMRIKRAFLIIVFAMAGALAGAMLSDVVINILFLDPFYKSPIIIVSTLLMVSLALLLTAGTGKAVQDAYWKMALLRKVVVISKKLDNVSIISNEELDEMVENLNELEENEENISLEEDINEKKKEKLKLKAKEPRIISN